LPNELRPYQLDIAASVMASALQHQGLTFSVEVSRQGGKNETSAHIEAYILGLCCWKGWNLIKCAPTQNPQVSLSINRLRDVLDSCSPGERPVVEDGHIVRLGTSRAIFLSASETASVVGHTAHLLEVDEAQDVAKEKYYKEFRPMGASTNATNVLYGTTWDDSTLLEEVKQANLELERGTASGATSATTGRRWRNTTPPTSPTPRPSGRGWAKTTRCS
jgi:phage terminase large subunit-like protein